jgi:hypothetical protein
VLMLMQYLFHTLAAQRLISNLIMPLVFGAIFFFVHLL